MIDNLLLADVSDLLGALLFEGLLLHGLVAVLAPDTSMTTLLTYDQLYNVQNKSIFIFLMSCSILVSYFLLYRGLHFFSGISVLVGLHFWSICNATREYWVDGHVPSCGLTLVVHFSLMSGLLLVTVTFLHTSSTTVVHSGRISVCEKMMILIT